MAATEGEREKRLEPARRAPSSGGSPGAPGAPPGIAYQRQLQALKDLGINYEVADPGELTEANGWRVDSYEAELPSEPPGPPLDDGSFAIARSVVQDYSFVDPGLIRGYYDPSAPLLGRVMLLKVTVFGAFKFEFGVRVNKVIDEERGEESIWGYAYQTLQGHFEMGEITFEVAKNRKSGRVLFRINAYSKLGAIRNLVYRVGARLFARRLQLRYAEYALKRLPEMVAERLGEGRG